MSSDPDHIILCNDSLVLYNMYYTTLPLRMCYTCYTCVEGHTIEHHLVYVYEHMFYVVVCTKYQIRYCSHGSRDDEMVSHVMTTANKM